MSKFLIRAVPSGVKFDLTASNGQVIATSEAYRTEAACRKGIASVIKNAPLAPLAPLENQTEEGCRSLPNPKFELFRDRSGGYRFRLRARNGGIIATSEHYVAKAACLDGIASVRTCAPAAQVQRGL